MTRKAKRITVSDSDSDDGEDERRRSQQEFRNLFKKLDPRQPARIGVVRRAVDYPAGLAHENFQVLIDANGKPIAESANLMSRIEPCIDKKFTPSGTTWIVCRDMGYGDADFDYSDPTGEFARGALEKFRRRVEKWYKDSSKPLQPYMSYVHSLFLPRLDMNHEFLESIKASCDPKFTWMLRDWHRFRDVFPENQMPSELSKMVDAMNATNDSEVHAHTLHMQPFTATVTNNGWATWTFAGASGLIKLSSVPKPAALHVKAFHPEEWTVARARRNWAKVRQRWHKVVTVVGIVAVWRRLAAAPGSSAARRAAKRFRELASTDATD